MKYLTRNASHDSRCATLLQNLYGKQLVFHSRYSLSDRSSRIVFVYDPGLKSWPGSQPETVVIADARYRLLAWEEVGGSPQFNSAALNFGNNGNPILSLTRRHRFRAGGRGTYGFSLDNDQINPVGDVVWNKDDVAKLEEMMSGFIDEIEEVDAKRR